MGTLKCPHRVDVVEKSFFNTFSTEGQSPLAPQLVGKQQEDLENQFMCGDCLLVSHMEDV